MNINREEWLFKRAEGFYVIEVPSGQHPEEHAKLNPGTLEIRNALTDKLLWSLSHPLGD